MDAPCSCTCSAQYSASGSNCCEKGITGKAVCIVAAKVSGKWFKNSTGTNHTDMEQDEQKEIDEKLSDGETIKSHSSIYYEEYSVQEISEMLQRNPSTIQTQLERARKKLKALLEQKGGFHYGQTAIQAAHGTNSDV